jgi:hypothetical protein
MPAPAFGISRFGLWNDPIATVCQICDTGVTTASWTNDVF